MSTQETCDRYTLTSRMFEQVQSKPQEGVSVKDAFDLEDYKSTVSQKGFNSFDRYSSAIYCYNQFNSSSAVDKINQIMRNENLNNWYKSQLVA